MIEALGIAMVKNEADIIEAFVRHNLAFMDALVIVDNQSVDGTRETLVNLRRRGLPIILFDDPVVAYFQAEKVTAVYRKVVPLFKPRFVFLLDADEFIVAPSRDSLYSQLRELKPGTQGCYSWRTYIPDPTAPVADATDPLRSITHRRRVEHPWSKSVIATKPMIDTKLRIQQGGHDVTLAGISLRKVPLQDVALAHFPIRSVDQITAKALVGWIAYLERNRHRTLRGAGFQWKALYDQIVYGAGITTEDLTREALAYAQASDARSNWPDDVVHDPVEPAYSGLTAKSAAPCTPLRKVVACVDKIFNPEATSIRDAEAMGFLHDSDDTHQSWRSLVRRFAPSTKPKTAFTNEWHGQNLYVDLPPFRYLAERDRPESVLDIGCGAGAYLKYFASQGTQQIMGVDGIDGRFGYLNPDEYSQADLTDPLQLNRTFDLVICVEVIEHLPAQSERVLVDSIVRHARDRILFSGARPGQPGVGHINCRPISYWLELFASYGWYPSLFDSLAPRALATFTWFRSNLVVLTRDSEGATEASQHLAELGARQVKWDAQKPAVISHPFTETATALLAGAKGGT
jgi:SAM-dependent methyltransferase